MPILGGNKLEQRVLQRKGLQSGNRREKEKEIKDEAEEYLVRVYTFFFLFIFLFLHHGTTNGLSRKEEGKVAKGLDVFAFFFYYYHLDNSRRRKRNKQIYKEDEESCTFCIV